jgi:hypothetical protein
MGACVAFVVQQIGPIATLQSEVAPDITFVNVSVFNGRTSITFTATQGIDVDDGPRLACEVVRPALEISPYRGASFRIVNRAGDVIATDQTPCGPLDSG